MASQSRTQLTGFPDDLRVEVDLHSEDELVVVVVSKEVLEICGRRLLLVSEADKIVSRRSPRVRALASHIELRAIHFEGKIKRIVLRPGVHKE